MNVLLATRNFQHRVDTFKREVIFGRNQPMKIRHLSYRVEFQGRGAGHIHGVFWVDLTEIRVKDVDTIVLKNAFEKLRHRKALDEEEVDAIEKFTDMSTTCTRSTNVAGKEAVQIAEEVNWHSHSKSCRKEGSQCRWKFPRIPLAKTKFIDVNRLVHEEEYRMSTEEREDILRRVMAVLMGEKHGKTVLSEDVLNIMHSYPNIKKIQDNKISYPEKNYKAQDGQSYPNDNVKAQDNESYSKQS